MNRKQMRRDVAALVRELRPTICDDYRASDDDTRPTMCLTIGANRTDWDYQTGDNSYTGGAYGYSAPWAVVTIYRDSNSFALADEVMSQLDEGGAFERVQS